MSIQTLIRRASPASVRAVVAGVVLLSALQAAHILLRPQTWSIHGDWATTNYVFSMIFVGPFAAGLGAWQGVQMSRGLWLGRQRPLKFAMSFGARLLLAVEVVYLAFWIVTLLMVGDTAGTIRLDPMSLFAVLVSLLGIAGYFCAGMCLGVFWRSLVAPPLVSLMAFGMTIVAWSGVLSSPVSFGGATGGLFGSRFRLDTLGYRSAFWLIVVLASSAMIVLKVRGQSVKRPIGMASAALAVVSALSWGLPNYEQVPVEYACAAGTVEVCVPESVRYLAEPGAELIDYYQPLLEVADYRIGDRFLLREGIDLHRVARSTNSSAEQTKARRIMADSTQRMFWPWCGRASDFSAMSDQETSEFLEQSAAVFDETYEYGIQHFVQFAEFDGNIPTPATPSSPVQLEDGSSVFVEAGVGTPERFALDVLELEKCRQ